MTLWLIEHWSTCRSHFFFKSMRWKSMMTYAYNYGLDRFMSGTYCMAKSKGSCLFLIQEARSDDVVCKYDMGSVLTGPTLPRQKIAHRKENISCHKRVTLSGALLKWMLLNKCSRYQSRYLKRGEARWSQWLSLLSPPKPRWHQIVNHDNNKSNNNDNNSVTIFTVGKYW